MPLTRLVFGAGVPFTVLWALYVVLLGAGAYDDSGLRAALASSPSCAEPCFMEVVPGVTTVSDVYRIFDAHPWVDRIVLGRPMSTITVGWRWNGLQPAFIDPERPSFLSVAARARISTFNLPTRITLGDLWLAIGSPDTGGLFVHSLPVEDGRLNLPADEQIVFYTRYGMVARVPLSCGHFWQQTVYLTWDGALANRLHTPDPLPLHRVEGCES